MSETVTGLRFIRGKLVADTTLMTTVQGVYDDAGPRDAAMPFVVISFWDSYGDVLCLDGTFIMAPLTYQVRVVGQGGSYAPLEASAARIKTLLHKATGSAGSGVVYECLQVEPIQYREDAANGVTYCHLGGLYELQVRG